GAVQLGNLLDGLAHAKIADIPLLTPVTLEGIEAQLASTGQDMARVADDDQGADRLSLSSFPADLDGDVHNRLERLEGDRSLQGPQVARRESLEVLAQPDDAEGVQRLGLEARVHNDDPGAGLELIVGDGLDQGQADP